MSGLIIGFLIVVVLVALARLTYGLQSHRRHQAFEEHLDKHMGTITELRVRRNFHQGP